MSYCRSSIHPRINPRTTYATKSIAAAARIVPNINSPCDHRFLRMARYTASRTEIPRVSNAITPMISSASMAVSIRLKARGRK